MEESMYSKSEEIVSMPLEMCSKRLDKYIEHFKGTSSTQGETIDCMTIQYF